MDKIKYLFLSSRDEFYRIEVGTIVYFEADGNYTHFMLCNGQEGMVCMNLARMQTLLSNSLREHADIFARVGKRHIINLSFVYHIEILKQQLVLSNGTSFAYTLSVSKEALKKLKEIYLHTFE